MCAFVLLPLLFPLLLLVLLCSCCCRDPRVCRPVVILQRKAAGAAAAAAAGAAGAGAGGGAGPPGAGSGAGLPLQAATPSGGGAAGDRCVAAHRSGRLPSCAQSHGSTSLCTDCGVQSRSRNCCKPCTEGPVRQSVPKRLHLPAVAVLATPNLFYPAAHSTEAGFCPHARGA